MKNEKNILEIFKFFDEIERSKYTDWPIDLRSVSVNWAVQQRILRKLFRQSMNRYRLKNNFI